MSKPRSSIWPTLHIDSPATGMAGVMQVDPGNYIQAGAGTTLVTITQISPIYVTFPVPQGELDRSSQRSEERAPRRARPVSGWEEPG